jgi:hypothetical protein
MILMIMHVFNFSSWGSTNASLHQVSVQHMHRFENQALCTGRCCLGRLNAFVHGEGRAPQFLCLNYCNVSLLYSTLRFRLASSYMHNCCRC